MCSPQYGLVKAFRGGQLQRFFFLGQLQRETYCVSEGFPRSTHQRHVLNPVMYAKSKLKKDRPFPLGTP